ncbi:MAG TPA: Ig-like domain-containing protein, partial [Rhodoglobus sp.]|nr:Ig-like domain-containing protein [Rhodoglobus sp.]
PAAPPAAPPATPTRPVVAPPPLVVPPPPPIDTVAPAAPTVALVADTLTNRFPVVLSGTGEPGATIEIGPSAVASAVVDADGTWTASAPLPDGDHELVFQQRDAAGNVSAPVTVPITVDTIALPPQLASFADPSPFILLPVLAGTAEPGAEVTVTDGAGIQLSDTADDTGAWSVPVPDPGVDGRTLTATQVDPAGNVSQASVPSAPLVFERPTLVSPTEGQVLPSNGGTVVEVRIAGIPGQRVEVLIDGKGTGNEHVLESEPIVRVTPPLADGTHVIGVRYVAADTSRVGSLAPRAFTIAP